jgi:hypothetical protein
VYGFTAATLNGYSSWVMVSRELWPGAGGANSLPHHYALTAMQRNTDELEESPNPPDLFTATLAAIRNVRHRSE